jgi:hypothetical protein
MTNRLAVCDTPLGTDPSVPDQPDGLRPPAGLDPDNASVTDDKEPPR